MFVCSFQTDKTHLRVSESKGGAVPTWKIQLKKPLNKGDKGQLDVEVILSKAVELFPKEITQKEKQFVRTETIMDFS